MYSFFHTDKIASLPDGGKVDDRMDPGDLFFRVDHQTFRKLPRTKGIIFGVWVSLLTSNFLTDISLRVQAPNYEAYS